jgi:hypothetical protein
MTDDVSLRLGSGSLVATDYRGNQAGAGLFFEDARLAVKSNDNFAPLQVASASGETDKDDYAVTHWDLEQNRDPVAWVQVVVHDSTATTSRDRAIKEHLTVSGGAAALVFFKDTGAVERYATGSDGEPEVAPVQDVRVYTVGDVLPRPLVVVHTGSGTVYRVSGTIGTQATVAVAGSRRYEAVAYQRELGTHTGSFGTRQNEYLFKSDRKGYLESATNALEALPKWMKIEAKALRAEVGMAECMVLVENVGLCRIGTDINADWDDSTVIPWAVLRETNAVVEIRDVTTTLNHFKSPLSKHALQINTNGVHLLTQPKCRSNTKPIIFENVDVVAGVEISDVVYDAHKGFVDSPSKYTIGPVSDYDQRKSMRQALATTSDGTTVIYTLGLLRDESNEVQLTDGVPQLRLRCYQLDDTGHINPNPSTVVDLDSVDGIPQPLEYEYDDLSHVVMEVAVSTAIIDEATGTATNEYGKIQIVKLLYHDGVWTVAPSYLLENAWIGQNTVSHLRVVGGRDATSTRTGDVVVSGGIGVGGTIWCQTMQTLSDATRKTGISTLRNCLSTVRSMVGTSWQWRNNGKPDTGFIAQDLARVVPTSVQTDPHDGTMSINYNSLMPYLSGAVQELAQRMDDLEADTKRQRLV